MPDLLALAFLLAWSMLNLACLGLYDLAPDEAHYWHWSRHLAWSYYSKGPLVAWLIRGSCEVFGNSELAVRLPAVLSSAALLGGVYLLIADILGSRRAALAGIVCASTLPGTTTGALLMTIDPPLLACWCGALVGLHRALGRDSRALGWWSFAGACSALGVLAKYPMVLLAAALVGFLIARRRAEFRRPGIWVFLALTALGLVPIAIWAASHDWVSLRHVLGQTGIGGDENASLWNPLACILGQCGILLGFWFVAFAAACWRYRNANDEGLALMWWASAPVWLFYLAASIGAPSQLNWPAAAYIGGAVLIAAWVRERWGGRTIRSGVILAALFGMFASTALRAVPVIRPVMAKLVESPSAEDPTPVRKLDATCRLAGWQALAQQVKAVRDRLLAEELREPAVAGMLWTIPGELAFYCDWRPEAYSFGSALADRHSQYDIWRPNPVDDAGAFRGRTFIYIGDPIPNADRIFERVEPPIPYTHVERGVPVAHWTIWVCHGFRGFPKRESRADY